jgi:hypothetical protein
VRSVEFEGAERLLPIAMPAQLGRRRTREEALHHFYRASLGTPSSCVAVGG